MGPMSIIKKLKASSNLTHSIILLFFRVILLISLIKVLIISLLKPVLVIMIL